MNEAIKDFNVTVKIRNNQLVERREEIGLSAPKVSEAIGISYPVYLGYENMQRSPFSKKTSELKESADRICRFYSETVEVLWPEAVKAIEKSRGTLKLSGEEAMALVGRHTIQLALPVERAVDTRMAIQQALDTLTDREREVMAKRYGFGGPPESLREIGATMVNMATGEEGITPENVRRIEGNALRKLRHSSRSAALKEVSGISDQHWFRCSTNDCSQEKTIYAEDKETAVEGMVRRGWKYLKSGYYLGNYRSWICAACVEKTEAAGAEWIPDVGFRKIEEG